MKNYYLTILLTLFCAITTLAQITFNNNDGDLLWSNPLNWAGGSIPASTDVVATSIDGSLVDQDFTIKGIQNFFGTTNNVSFGGNGILTIDFSSTTSPFAIKSASSNGVALSFAGSVTINNSAGGQTFMRKENNSNNLIEFEDGSVLTLSTNLETRTSSVGNAVFNFNGALAGNAALRIGASTTAIFGNTSDNSGFNGDFVFVGADGAIVVNTADNTVFLPSGHKFQVNQNNVSVEINGANVIQGNFVVGGSYTLTVAANKDQGNMGFISFPADGTLNLDVDNSVTNLSFANCSEVAWTTGTLNITGFTEGVLRFGTDNTGLTAGQLSQISADGIATGQALGLDANGYLVLESSLSVNDIEKNSIKPIAYPTLATNKLYFRTPQNDVKILGLSGNVIFNKKSDNQSEITIDNLSPGLYFIVFDNQRVQKFIKK